MKKHLHRPKKRFGQHFLEDIQVLEDIVAAISPKATDHMVEIGPGQGELTQYFTHTQHLDIIEIDRDLVENLRIQFANHHTVAIHQQDVLDFSFPTLSNTPQSLRVVGNLPYNISTPLLFRLFESLPLIIDMHFLLQKEVVERLTAKLGSAQYGRLSVMSQYFCDNYEIFSVSPNAFNPPPQVWSAMIRLIPKKQRLNTALDFQTFSIVVREAFNHRRKTLGNALKKILDAKDLLNLNIDPKIRPQQTTIDDFVKISNMLYSKNTPL